MRLGEGLHRFLLSSHHVLIDGWCLPILYQEVFALYDGLALGSRPRLPKPPAYRDYIQWLQRQDLAGAEDFWRRSLRGFTAPTPLWEDQEDRGESGRGERVLGIAEELTAALGALARRHQMTLSTLLEGVWGLLLARRSGEDDVVFGATVSGRSAPIPGIESMVGLFINTLPVRLRVNRDEPLGPWLAGLREQHAARLQHEHTPLVQVQRWSEVPRGPLFDSILAFENYPAAQEVGGGDGPPLAVEPLRGVGRNNFAMALIAFAGERLELRLNYDARRFEEATVLRLLGQIERLLAGMVEDPGRRLSDLPLLPEPELRQVLAWGGERAPEPEEETLSRRFERQAARTPEAVAVVCDGAELTYSALDRRANGVAWRLIGQGVRPGDRVALLLDRSLDLVAAILGVLKAGAAYVPIDPRYPQDRIDWVAGDSGAKVVLTDGECLDRTDSPGLDVLPEAPAYVIYTSGSTGRPKGVLVSHRSVASLFAAFTAGGLCGFGERDVWTLFHSYAFDFSVWELWGALLHGSRLVVVPHWTARSPEAFLSLLRRERVTVLSQTPSAFRQILWAEGEDPGPLDDLRLVVFGGEALEPERLAPWFDRHGDERPLLANLYGITETTVHVTWKPLSRADVGSPIGRPLPGWQVHLLDRGLRPVPIGAPGEICVGGVGLALGYLGRPELTAERFVPNPWGPPGERLYRSGDLARHRPDGELEFLGRIDHQIKIRGFRVELGEIESALARHPGVREAVVLARSSGGETALAAYVTGEAGPDALRAHLAGLLPDYMVPVVFILLDRLPLTEHGKVDRRALPDPAAPAREGAGPLAQRPPRTPLESFLADLWRDVLGVEQIGVEDDFFALGGNSLTGARLINRLQKALAEIVHVVAIFDAPTIGSLADYLGRQHREAVLRVWGPESLRGGAEEVRAERVDEARIAELRSYLPAAPPVAERARRNPPAVFVLSPPRSGTTLLRAMLGGHPQLFAPPELELLGFTTLAERRAAFTGRDSFWLEGAIRAVLEIEEGGVERARGIVEEAERQGLSTADFYLQIQERLGGRLLVDKTPSYALDAMVLRRAEEVFEGPFYIHLVRHPLGMIRSFEEAKLDQIFFRREHPFSRRELAELIWVVSHRNVLEHLATVPAERWIRVRFEDLVRDPERVLCGVCDRLGLPFDPALLRPYEDRRVRMTDGLHAESRMLGDVKFHEHQGVDPAVADRWREMESEEALGEPTRELTAALGYAMPGSNWLPLSRTPRDGRPLPLSFAQERLWFLEQLSPGSPAYNVPAAVRLAGTLDVTALAGSLREIVRHHEALRTRFAVVDGQPAQVVSPVAEAPMPLIDLSGLPEPLRDQEVRRIVAAEAERSFELASGPLFRCALLCLGSREHVALFNLHHIVSDGWSMGILVRELGTLYTAFAQGRPSPLPELPLQYADYAAWQRRWLYGKVLASKLAGWRERLAGAPPVLALPLDRPRPAVPSGRGGSRRVLLPAGILPELAAAGRSAGATPFMVLLAAFQALLHRYTGETDVLVGTPVANRDRAEIEGLIGLFVNTLVLRTDLGGDPGFGTLLGRVRETVLGSFAHQDLPFEKVVEALAPERSLSHPPLFQVFFGLQNGTRRTLALPGLELAPEEAATGAAKFDLSLLLAEGDWGTGGTLDYNADLFYAVTAERLLGHYEILLGEIVQDPSRRLSDLPLLSAPERAQLLTEWSDTAVDITKVQRDLCVHELFELQAARTPEALAVRHLDEVLTYRELNGRANALARHLRAMGVGPEVAVALCLDRSVEMLVGVVGALKAGGFFVPLDPAAPAQRLACQLADCGASVVLTQERFLPKLAGARAVCLDRDWPAIESMGRDAMSVAVDPGNLCYVMYTSGSTGRPKGAMVQHRSAVNLALRVLRGTAYPEDRPLRLTLNAPVFFDGAIKTVLQLLAGHLIDVVPGGVRLDARAFLDFLDTHAIDVLDGTPSHVRVLLAEGIAPGRVLLGGEAVDQALWDRLAGSPSAFYNLYGPAEATVVATACRIAPLALDKEPSIGRPLANVRIHLLDGGGQPVPAGVTGRLHIGGPNLARGYLGRPDLTAERFVPDPFGGEPGGRLYDTGDLARWRADGTLAFQGRADHQVKIRGIRVELGEIESVLAEHPAVGAAAVLAPEEAPGDRRLVAYVAPGGQPLPPVAELRTFLADRLPDFMVPAWIVPLPALPRTPNGKLDRAALPAPEGPRVEADAGAAPRTPVEEVLAGIWAELLGRERIGVEESFFALGGHSLLVTQVISRVRQAFSVDLPLRELFEAPTVAGLAAAVERALRAGLDLEAPPLVRSPLGPPHPLSFAQLRLWFLDQMAPDSPLYNVPFALRLDGALDVSALGAALDGIVARHEMLRTTFSGDPEGIEPVQHVAPPRPLLLPLLDLSALPAEHREAEALRLTDREAARPFDLRRGPLVRAALLRLGTLEHVALFTLHHIACDGWSTGVLVREVAALYAGAGRWPSPLPPLPIQYGDFARWQREWLRGEVLERHLGFWRERLAGAPPLLDLPTDRPRPPVRRHRGSRRAFALPASLLEALRVFARGCGATLFMALLAAYDALLSRYAGTEDVVVGSPIANRNRAETEGLIGFFVNNLVLRTDLGGDPTFEELAGRVREVTLAAYAHQDLPFEKLVDELRPGRSLAHSPLFQVMLVLQNARSEELELPGLTLGTLLPRVDHARFDLTFTLAEQESGLAGLWGYDTDLFDATTVERLTAHLGNLLEGATAAPGTRLSELPVLGRAELGQVLLQGSRTETSPALLTELLAVQAVARPDGPALVSEEGTLTWAALQARVRRVARHLRGLGVGLETRVGLRLAHSVDWVVALLGVLEAGGAFLPLDPSYPPKRLAAVVEDSGAALVLDEIPSGESLKDPGVEVPLDALAYVIYTSGSTGRPKGVLVPHRGLVNLALAQARLFRVTPQSRILQFASPAFDAAISEVAMALATGAALHLAPRQAMLPGPELMELLRRREISVVTLPPSALAALPDPQENPLPSLRSLVVAGEACPPALAARWAAGRRLVNAYGPTETTVCATAGEVSGSDASRPLSLGAPLENLRAVLLDPHGMPVPLGVPGELYVGGVALARGYLDRPDLTAERFVPDPLSGEPGARLYRTGDLGRLRLDGALELAGRVDRQIKIRGVRVEPGEVEAALASHPEVREAAVAATGEGAERRLVAWFTGSAAPAGLRSFLLQRLPEPMVPSAFVRLESLPLTPSGKVDRAVLPSLGGTALEAHAQVPPRTALEGFLAGLWREVLQVEWVGIHDNFFELGGNSILGALFVNRLQRELSKAVPVITLFDNPTIAGLASCLEERGSVDLPLLAARPGSEGEPLPLSFAQQRLWFLHWLQPDSPAYHVPAAVRLTGALDVPALAAALREIARRHAALRTRFVVVEGQPAQVVDGEARTGFAQVDLSGLPEARRDPELRRLADAEAVRPFDLEHGPLWRTTLVRLGGIGDRDHAALFTLHHIVSDAWSMGVLVREIASLYPGLPPLPPLPVQYTDFALWQRGRLSGELLEAELAFWRERLAGAPAALALPVDRPRPPIPSGHGGVRAEVLPTEPVAALGRARGATPFMTLLAAWVALLHRLTGETDLLVGAPVAGRNRAELEGLIGFFVNTLVLRIGLSGDPSFTDLVERVRESALGAFAHQELPFERLVEEVAPERNLAHSPLFQVVFALQNAPFEPLALPGLTLSPLADGRAERTAKFDLVLAMAEDPGVPATLAFNRDLFDGATVARILGQLGVLLAGIVAGPDRPVSDLPLLSVQEQQALLVEWSGTVTDYPRGASIPGLFEEVAGRFPDAVAVVFGDEELTYRELDCRANRLARSLAALGVGLDGPVGICAERSPELVVGLLAILKAGGAYVPLDPAWPAERLALLLEDTRVPVLLVQERFADLPGLDRAAIRVPLTPDPSGDDSRLGLDVPSEALSYVLYTSGSTGRPKGVAATHRGVVRLVRGTSYARFGPGEVWLQLAPVTFDASTLEIWGALLHGGRLVLMPPGAPSIAGLGEALARHEVTSLWLTAGLFHAVVEEDVEALRPVRQLLAGGDVLLPERVRRVLEALPGLRLINGYGPTENTTFTCCHPMDHFEEAGRPVPLGRPVANTPRPSAGRRASAGAGRRGRRAVHGR